MTRQKAITFGLAAAVVLAVSWPFIDAQAYAEPQCNTRDSVVEQLSDRYHEAPVALGVTNNGGLIEVFSTDEGKTWSIIITSPQGMSCLVAAGEGWRTMEDISPDPET